MGKTINLKGVKTLADCFNVVLKQALSYIKQVITLYKPTFKNTTAFIYSTIIVFF